MHLSQLDITNYRNYEKQHVVFHPSFNIINGLNGMGKTNLLDAIYYLALTKSYFFNTDKYNYKSDQDFFRLEGSFFNKKKKHTVVAKIQKSKKKVFEYNQKPYDKLSNHVGLIPIVMIAPRDQDLIYDGSKARRRFMDQTLSQLDNRYLHELISYNHHLKQRNAYLKQLERPHHLDQALLHIYNENLNSSGNYIYQKRAEFVDELIPVFQLKYNQLSNNQEKTSLTYTSPLQSGSFLDILIQNQAKDLILKRTSSGIHRDDLVFGFKESDVKSVGSQGQQKSYVLALKLSQFELLNKYSDTKPIVLLDDVFDKLDRRRVEQLLKLLDANVDGQIFVTDTDENRLHDIFEELNMNFKQYIVEQGTIKQTYEKA